MFVGLNKLLLTYLLTYIVTAAAVLTTAVTAAVAVLTDVNPSFIFSVIAICENIELLIVKSFVSTYISSITMYTIKCQYECYRLDFRG